MLSDNYLVDFTTEQEEASEVIHSSIHKPTILNLSLSFESTPQVISPFGS